ncbi:hypothetical protein [Pseudobutyrivibrio sp. LB2011]|uniref:hypothetical protein n=1 Tax=Pseudobutyrivibrio sp. LB2011 TaxID=1408312 RepID=UPI0012DF0403|nr:hypothetical protein [Pseudobutyrivibrio sp. LB2011]
MIFTKCSICGKSITIRENDFQPGCRDFEDVSCPICNAFLTSVFTSGIPEAHVDEAR